MSTAAGSVSYLDLTGARLLFTDTGSYTAPVTSRVLTIFDANGNLLETYNMAANLTQEYDIAADAYLTFKLNVTDATGVIAPLVVNFLSAGFYTALYLLLMADSNCACGCNWKNIDIAEDFYKAAQRFTLAGAGVAANNNIVAANAYLNIQ